MITRLNIGGPSTHALLANRGLMARGHRCLLVHGTLHRGEASLPGNSYGPVGDVVQLPALQRDIDPRADARAALGLASIIRDFRPDVIHTHTSKAGLIGRLVGRVVAPSAVLVHTYHGNVCSNLFGSGVSRAMVLAERSLGRFTDAVVAISDEQREEIRSLRICPDRVERIELGLDLSRFVDARRPERRATARRRFGLSDDAVELLFAGRLVRVKRVDALIEALAPMLAADSRVHLSIVGDGPERSSLEGLVRAGRLGDRVAFRGWSLDMPEEYAAADVVVMASSWEGTPLTIIEGLAAGRPAVATDVGGVRDIIADGVTGFVVPRGDWGALRDAVERLVADQALRRRFGAAAAQGSQRFADHRLVTELEELYVRLAGGARIAATAVRPSS